MTWYKGRHRKLPGEIARTVHLTLSAEEWTWWEEIARQHEDSIGYTISLHLQALVARQKQMALEERHRVERDPVSGGWIGKQRAIGEQV